MFSSHTFQITTLEHPALYIYILVSPAVVAFGSVFVATICECTYSIAVMRLTGSSDSMYFHLFRRGIERGEVFPFPTSHVVISGAELMEFHDRLDQGILSTIGCD
jgi:hypothetical protein